MLGNFRRKYTGNCRELIFTDVGARYLVNARTDSVMPLCNYQDSRGLICLIDGEQMQRGQNYIEGAAGKISPGMAIFRRSDRRGALTGGGKARFGIP